MNGYIGYFIGKQIELHADSSYAAYLKAVEHFKPAKSKRHMVHVALCELNGVQVIHRAVN